MSNGFNDVLTGLVKESDPDGGVYRVNLSGNPEANAIVDATVDGYNRFTGRAKPTKDDLLALNGTKVSLLVSGKGAFGHTSLATIAGTVFVAVSGAVALLPKGKRNKGLSLEVLLSKGKVLDVELGYKGEAVLAKRATETRERFPTLTKFTQEHLDALPERGENCTLALFGTYPFYGERVASVVWLVHSYLAEDDIAESVLFIRPEFGTSEHGSAYGKNLLDYQVGVVEGFEPISFGEALKLADAPFEAVLERLVPRPKVAA